MRDRSVRPFDTSKLRCPAQYAGEGGGPSLALCPRTAAAFSGFGLSPYGTNCSYHRFKEAGGCEAQMTFVRPADFKPRLVQAFCTKQWPPSCFASRGLEAK